MTYEPVWAGPAVTWTLRVRGGLGACTDHFRSLRPYFDGRDTWLQAPAGPRDSLLPVLADLQAFGLEVVDIERLAT